MREDREAPDRPLREPRPAEHPTVSGELAAVFSRPDGFTGGIDHRDEPEAGITTELPPEDPALAEAFGAPAGAAALSRPPETGGEVARRDDDSPPDPWRDPSAPVRVGGPALEPDDKDDEVLDLTGEADRPTIGARELIFGRRLSWQAMAMLAACVAAVALVAGAAGSLLAGTTQLLTSSTVRLADAPADRERPANDTGAVVTEVMPAVVNIQVGNESGEGEGSGFVIDPRGYVVTNNHVVSMDGPEPAEDITVVFDDGNRVSAEVVGTDPLTDVAVLKVDDVAGLTVAALGDSDEVEVGETVIAIGSPLGLSKTVTEGIVSAVQRPIALGDGGADGAVVIDAIQTDAAINPGNSGGPLIDATGAVIGINTSIFTQTGGSIGLGFAIPINDVKRITESIIETGSMTHPRIGINTRSAANLNVDGALVANVQEGGAADEAGIREGDVITEFDGRTVRSADELVVAVRSVDSDRDVSVVVVRDGSRVDLTVSPRFD